MIIDLIAQHSGRRIRVAAATSAVEGGGRAPTWRPLRILILGVNYAPEVSGIGQMTTEFAEQLVARGHEVIVGTTFAFYPRWRWEEPPPLRRSETLNGVSIRRFRILLPRSRGPWWRIASDTSFAAAMLPNSAGLPRPDCVVAVSPPVQIAATAAILARRWGTRLCLLVKDLPLEAAVGVGMMEAGRALRLGLALERWAYTLVDRVVVIDEVFKANLIAKGVQPTRISVIPNWVDLDHVQPRSAEPDVRALLGASADDTLVLHTGSIGEKQDLVNVVEAAHLLRDRRFRFAFIGDGSQRSLVERAIHDRMLQSVRILPLQPPGLYPRLLASADLLMLNQRASVIDSVAPHKLLSYMAAGRPIVAAVNRDSVAARLVEDAGCGVVVQPEDPRALADSIESLRAAPDRGEALGRTGRAFVERTSDRRLLMGAWERLLFELCSELPGGRRKGSALMRGVAEHV
jgi:colanic acid biosynthesis glycosyl transferase WcaI